MHVVYVLKSTKHNWFYVGSSSNLTKRLAAHNAGSVRSTKSRAPYKIVYVEHFPNISTARRRERELKQSRAKKIEIVEKIHNKALSSNG